MRDSFLAETLTSIGKEGIKISISLSLIYLSVLKWLLILEKKAILRDREVTFIIYRKSKKIKK